MGLLCNAMVHPKMTCCTSHVMTLEHWLEWRNLSAKLALFILKSVLQENLVNSEPIVIGRSRGFACESRSICASLYNGIMIAEDKNFYRALESLTLTSNATNFRSRAAIEGRFIASRNNFHVHPSRWDADFFGMPVNVSVMALIGIGTNAVLTEEGGGGTWLWGPSW